jgi:hypothetical protein
MARNLAQGEDWRETGVGPFEDGAPLVAGLRAKNGREALLQLGPAHPVVLVGELDRIEAQLLEEECIEVGLNGRDSHVPAVRRLVDIVEGRASVEHVGSHLVGVHADGVHGVEGGHQRHDAVHHGHVDHLTLP